MTTPNRAPKWPKQLIFGGLVLSYSITCLVRATGVWVTVVSIAGIAAGTLSVFCAGYAFAEDTIYGLWDSMDRLSESLDSITELMEEAELAE